MALKRDIQCPACNEELSDLFTEKCVENFVPSWSKVDHLTVEERAFLQDVHFNERQVRTIKYRKDNDMNLWHYGTNQHDTLEDVRDIFEKWTKKAKDDGDFVSCMSEVCSELRKIAKNNGNKTWTRRFLEMLAEKVQDLGHTLLLKNLTFQKQDGHTSANF